MKDIIITLPATIRWEDYEKELAAAEAGDTLNFKVSNFPKGTQEGSRCYLVHQGFVRGWMLISGTEYKNFQCTTTGNQWNGKFIMRTGKFFKVEPVPWKGFQGFHYVDRLHFKDLN